MCEVSCLSEYYFQYGDDEPDDDDYEEEGEFDEDSTSGLHLRPSEYNRAERRRAARRILAEEPDTLSHRYPTKHYAHRKVLLHTGNCRCH